MGLVDTIKAISEREGVPESELILDEAELFLREHEGHGTHDIIVGYRNKILEYIYLKCTAGELMDERACPHQSEADYSFSIIYARNKSQHRSEIEHQKERRKMVSQIT